MSYLMTSLQQIKGCCATELSKRGRLGQPFEFAEIVLVVHNLLTGKWRRLVVPYTPLTYANDMLVGLCVDKETGSYMLVVAFVDSVLTKKAFVYNSPSASWTISAAEFPGLEQRMEFSNWDIQKSICCAGEVRLVEESDKDMRCDDEYPHFKTLIKYCMKLDTWFVATQQRPCEEACHLHIASFENRPILVNFDDVSKKRILFPEEFSSLVPGLVKFDAQAFRDVMSKAVYIHDDDAGYLERSNFLPRQAAAEGSALFIQSEHKIVRGLNDLDVIYGFNKDSPKVLPLPFLQLDNWTMLPFLTASTLKAFV